MQFVSRAARLAVLTLPLWFVAQPLPALAKGAVSPAPAQQGASALPALPPQTDPWLYRGSDVPHDAEWKFGQLPNGLRWAVRANSVPPGQVSIRIRMDVGSMYERVGEAGYAHLIEHLVFRQSKYLGQAQAIPTWQRLGATFGSDTNASTTPTETVFNIDLPDASPATLDESFKLLSGMMIAPNLSESDIRIEAPIVLAEKRERGGVAERLQDATRQLVASGQPLADHATIGSITSIEDAHQDSVRAFHARWYRPENAVIIASGDADPRLLAVLINKWFGDWRGVGAHTPAPDFGKPEAPAGADPANPVGATRVVVEPGASRAITYVVARPWHEKFDTIVYNQGLMLDQLATAIINRRLESRARTGASYLSAQVGQQNESRSVDATYVTVTPLDSDWRAALRDVRGVVADALATPPSADEIAREAAEINVAFESTVQQRALQPGGRLADDLVQAVDIHETVASPEAVLDIFRTSMPLFTPPAVLDHARKLFQGPVLRALYITPQTGEADEAALRAALLTKVAPDGHARPDPRPISFAELPPIGTPAAVPQIMPSGLLGIQQASFPNGVNVQLWPTKDDPGRVTVKVRFGAGYRAFGAGDTAYASLGGMALVGSGQGKLGQEELDRISTGRKLGYDFRMDDGYFLFSADTRAEDLADQLYLFADKFAEPRWDASPVIRARAAARLEYATRGASPQGVLERDLRVLQRGGDTRFGTGTPDQLAAATPDGFRKVWAPILAQGPIEVQVFGDFDRASALEALRATFGALPPRGDLPANTLPPSVGFAKASEMPTLLYHTGDANQAAAVISWPTGGGAAGVHQARHLEVLAQLFSNRLLEAMREKAGASYAPQVGSEWPQDLTNGGTITAVAQLQPEVVAQFFATADAIAADLAAKPVSPDELARVVEPLRQQISRAATSTAFFMGQVEGASKDASRYDAVRSLLPDYTAITAVDVQALAQQYLARDKAWRLAVLPQGSKVSIAEPANSAFVGR